MKLVLHTKAANQDSSGPFATKGFVGWCNHTTPSHPIPSISTYLALHVAGCLTERLAMVRVLQPQSASL